MIGSEHVFEDSGGILNKSGANGPEEALSFGPLGAFRHADATAEQLSANDGVVVLLEGNGKLANGGVDTLATVASVTVGPGILEAEGVKASRH